MSALAWRRLPRPRQLRTRHHPVRRPDPLLRVPQPWRIDPETGERIDPNTGEYIDLIAWESPDD